VGERPFDEFYRRELPGLVALARALCPPPLAEDVAQEAMLVALRRWSEISELNRPEAWVRRICANLAVSQFRRRLAEVRALGRTRPPEPSALGDGAHEGFWELVRRLPPRQAQAVALRYLFDLSVEDVASTLGVSQGSVKVHLSRARQTLARQLGAEGEERS
jgi:RNA polymerase sigma-70 factor (ECF subfamily)